VSALNLTLTPAVADLGSDEPWEWQPPWWWPGTNSTGGVNMGDW